MTVWPQNPGSRGSGRDDRDVFLIDLRIFSDTDDSGARSVAYLAILLDPSSDIDATARDHIASNQQVAHVHADPEGERGPYGLAELVRFWWAS